MTRSLGNGLELDDDRARIDVAAVHAFLSGHAYWALGRALAVQQRLVDEAARVVGLYDNGRQIGFCRAASDGVAFAYLADVYVLPEYRGRGLGEELVREMVEGGGELRERRWLLHTGDAHALYRRFGWGEPSERLMERPPDS
jgi:ribosomal protein S18 acetylase RimI-like enzyme